MKPPIEFKITCVRECQPAITHVQSPEQAFQYWKANIENAPWFDPCKECLVTLIINVRHRIIGHNLVSLGTLDQCNVHPREVLRPVIVAAGYAFIIMHNHPSGDASPSDADLMFTRHLIRAGQLLKIELLDHVIVGEKYLSLKDMGYFTA